MDSLNFKLSGPDSKRHRSHLQKMRAASAASHESVLRLIDAQEELEGMIEKNPDMKLFECLEALLNENARLKGLESVQYVKDLEEENTLLRDLQGMSPITRIRPPLPKPNPYAFWTQGKDVAALRAEIAKQKKTVETVDELLGNSSIPIKGCRLLTRARTVINASRMDSENKINEYHSYVATCKRKREQDGYD